MPPPGYGHSGAVSRPIRHFTLLADLLTTVRIMACGGHDTANGSWYEFMPASNVPSPRAWFASTAAKVQLTPSSSRTPGHSTFTRASGLWPSSSLASSRLAIATPIGGGSAFSLGGRSAAGVAVGQTYAFGAVEGWTPLLAAGTGVQPS
jgi:hypothetical protein